MTTIGNLRIKLADARIDLRTAKDALETAKTIATMDVAGKNDDERKRNQARALTESGLYGDALIYLRNCEATVEHLEAALDAAKDERAAEELRIRDQANQALDRYAAALEQLARRNPIHAAIDAALPF